MRQSWDGSSAGMEARTQTVAAFGVNPGPPRAAGPYSVAGSTRPPLRVTRALFAGDERVSKTLRPADAS
jgi:hypothetical protein